MKIIKRALVSVLGIILVCLLVWELSPTLVLRHYNAVNYLSADHLGSAIIESNPAEFIPGHENDSLSFKRVTIDSSYHTEGASVVDVNRDGLIDILTGDYWYEAPMWTRHNIRRSTHDAIAILRPSVYLKSLLSGNGIDLSGKIYPMSFYAFAHDVDEDGWPDSVVVDWTTFGAYWYENPGVDVASTKQFWIEHKILNHSRNETPIFIDVLGMGHPQLLIGSAPYELADGDLFAIQLVRNGIPVFHQISGHEKVETNGANKWQHGLGAGDVDGDGNMDVVFGSSRIEATNDVNKYLSVKIGDYQFYDTGGGWYQQLKKSDGTSMWKLHLLPKLGVVSNIHVMEISGDSKPDIIAGSAHDYGLFWFEQGDAGQWIPHVIDASYSQLHTSQIIDIDGDGLKDIITGKTVLAHFGLMDPDELSTPVIYWYKQVKRLSGESQFIRYLIDDQIGLGRHFMVADINSDGLQDVIVGNRNGVNILVQVKKKDSISE